MDNCSSHNGEFFRELCVKNGIIPVLLPPHASNQLQMLDLCLFAATKRKIEYFNETADVRAGQLHHIVTVTNGFMSAANAENIVASFRNGGVSLMLDDAGVVRCTITPETARCLLRNPFPQLDVPESEGESESEYQEPDADGHVEPAVEEYYRQCADLIDGFVPDDWLSLGELAQKYQEVFIDFDYKEREPVREEIDPLTEEQHAKIQQNCARVAEKYWPWDTLF
jgi:hypothetical protein